MRSCAVSISGVNMFAFRSCNGRRTALAGVPLRSFTVVGQHRTGEQVYAHIIQSGSKPNIVQLNTLVNMYAKSGSLVDARQVFEGMRDRDVFTWTIMIAGYSKHGCGKEALRIYDQMQLEGVAPNRVTFICVLNACASLRTLEKGKQVHADIIKSGISSNNILETALVDMYAKCGNMKDAGQVFSNMAKRNVVTWSVVIAGYAQLGCGREALKIYEQMQQEGVMPNRVTFTCILNACASLGALERGKQVHADIVKAGITPDVILQNALVDMYAKCGSVENASQVFDKMAKRDVISWSAMIAGYSQQNCQREALKIYKQMQQEGVMPNMVTFISVLNACASLGALEEGKGFHADIMKAGIMTSLNLENALLDMYAKCGSVRDARQFFDNMAERDVISWSAMITGYGQHGCGRDALQLFEQMQLGGLKPNNVTFISLLSACSHAGLVDEGHHYFNSMTSYPGLTPTLEHFCCMVDLLGRAGQLDGAEEFIRKMPVEPDASVWGALLSACRVHGDVKLAECTAKRILESDLLHAGVICLHTGMCLM